MSEKKILIVDDDESITTVYKMILEEQGYKVDTASSGKEAISLAEPPYDLVVLDIKLPDITGDQVAKVMKERMMADNIVLMTGYPELVESTWALDIDIADILVKPFSPDVLQRLIREALSTKYN